MFAIGFSVSLGIMLITDYMLGAEAEFLNAWTIVIAWIKPTSSIPPSMVMQKFGLAGATIIMLLANLLAGVLLVFLIRFISHIIINA